MSHYYLSYGPIQRVVDTLKEARLMARVLARETIYEIKIVHSGDVVESLVPRVTSAGRFTFRTVKARSSRRA